MHRFSIKDLENLSGIKAHTLRMWEQRYGLLVPRRNKSKHRLYDNGDLKKLLRVSLLYHRGWKISKIAHMHAEALLAAVQDSRPDKSDTHFFVTQLLEKALDLDKEGFVTQLEESIQAIGFEACVVQVCYPLLQKIGLLWMTDRLIPAQEHFCSYIIQHKIIAETDKLPPPQHAPEILIFSPHGEQHELPLHFIHYLLRKWGWTTLFLGTNVKMDLLKTVAATEKLTHLFLHVTTNFTGFGLDDYFEVLCKTFRGKTIAASGAAVFSVQRAFTNLLLLKSDEAIYRFVRKEAPYFGVT